VVDLKLLLAAVLAGIVIAAVWARFGENPLVGFDVELEDLIAASQQLKEREASSKDQNHPSSPADSGKSRW
jgi:hypothetical protein